MSTYLRVLVSFLLLLAMFPMAAVFFRLFFYEDAFSVRQVFIQGGAQLLLFTFAYLIAAALKRLWWADASHGSFYKD